VRPVNVTLGSVLGVLGGLAAGALAGGAFGWWSRGRSSARFWIGSAVALLGGGVLVYVGYLRGPDWLSSFGVGVMGGGPTGIKYGEGMPAFWRGGDPSDRDGDSV
jgi:hypothetical protein